MTIIAGGLLVGSAFNAFALRDITLSWNPINSTSLAGFNVYTLEENTLIPTKQNVGLSNQARITGLKEGLTYRFAVTAYNHLGLETAPSAPLDFFVPVPLEIMAPTISTPFARLQFPVSPGRIYQLQASGDLKSWTTIWQTSSLLFYTQASYLDIRSFNLDKQYYRLLIR